MSKAAEALIAYLHLFIGKPYIWGGEGPTGFDCSGLVREALKSVGHCPKGGDQTAQMLHDYFLMTGEKGVLKPGSLCFFGPQKITHVAVAINDWQMIEAGGGDANNQDVAQADKDHAFVRIRPIQSRADLRAVIFPPY
jgi:cell wall-associated NlpC family hydrolase